jgi:cytochrome bd-type quinol oxidase subunit 2
VQADDAERRKGLAKGSRVACGISAAVAIVLVVGPYVNGLDSEASHGTASEVALCLAAIALLLAAAILVPRRSALAALLCGVAYLSAVAGRAIDSHDPRAIAIWAMYLLPTVAAALLALASRPGRDASHST